MSRASLKLKDVGLQGLGLHELLREDLQCGDSDDSAKYKSILYHLSLPLIPSVISSLILFLPR